MVYLILFITELFLLFLFSRTLTNSLARLIYKISHSRGFTYNFLAVIFLPGTIIHEIAHMLIAGILFVPSGDMEIFPQIDGNEVKFGSVKIAQTDPVRRFIIGIAPFIFGLTLMLAVLFLGIQFFSTDTTWWQVALVILFVFEIANTMFSSKKDMEGAFVFFGVIFFIAAILIGTLYFTNTLASVLSWFSRVTFPDFSEFFKKSLILLSIPLGLDIILISLVKILRF